MYKNNNQEAKRAIAVTLGAHYNDLYDKVNTRDDKGDRYGLVKSRYQYTQDLCCLNDKAGVFYGIDLQATMKR